MTGKQFSDAMNELDSRYVRETLAYKKPAIRSGWMKGMAVAACLALTASALAVWRFRTQPDPPPTQPADTEPVLEPLVIPDLKGEMGYEGYLCFDPSEVRLNTPWNDLLAVDTLPVYRNNAYDPSELGVAIGLTETEMVETLQDSLEALGLEATSVEWIPNIAFPDDPLPTGVRAVTDEGELIVRADATIEFFFPEEGVALPEDYHFTSRDTTDQQAQETLAYLAEKYRAFLGMEDPVGVTWGRHNIYGEFRREYLVFDAAGSETEDFLNYHLCPAWFYANEEGRLRLIRIYDHERLAEKVGDYPIITVDEAKQRLLAGNYQTSVPYALSGEENIVWVDLMYRTGYRDEMLIPYYRFYAYMPESPMFNCAEGLKDYGAYYVPAIADEYIANMPLYDGYFN